MSNTFIKEGCEFGFCPGCASNAKLSNQDFDLIITDLYMPNRDGFTLIDHLRKIPKYFRVKMIVVSGCLSKDIAISIMRKNIKHIVVKPFTARQILENAFDALKIEKKSKSAVDKIIQKATERMRERRARINSAIPDHKVVEMIKKSKGEI